MSYKEIHYRDEYVSHKMDLVREFYLPVLSQTAIFNRAVGYFRSDFLYQISKGMSAVIRNNGKVNIITSPELTLEDIEKIEQGYELKKLITSKLSSIIKFPETDIEAEQANYIAHLIASNYLDIKIAVTKDIKNNGLFHEKWGVLSDKEGNKLSMVGSNNDTYSGLINNHESFELNYSWLAETDLRKIVAKEKRFHEMWNNTDDSLIVTELPHGLKEEILKYKKDHLIPEEELYNSNRTIIEKKIYQMGSANLNELPEKINVPYVPEEISIRDYQWDAYRRWEENDYKGILSMATGTGKTITALNALVELYNKTNRLFVVIVCPYQHLVEQWVEDIEKFNIAPIIGYSKSKQKQWKIDLKNQVKLYNLGKKGRFSCFITTNATYGKPETREILGRLKGDVLFIVDEAHNIGSETGLLGLLDNYNYRLALSATYERKYDEDGTAEITKYFKGVVYEIGIKEAIFEKKCLVEYEYYPVLTFLSDNEFLEYKELTKRIAKGLRKTKNGKTYLSNDAKLAANLRSLLIASSQGKIEKLREFIPNLKTTKNNLIYCGAAKISMDDLHEVIDTDETEYRQVDLVRDLLIQNDITAARFTAEEDVDQRKFIKEQFANGTIETVIAIKCLDEGVNIPSIERAYILASSKDQKQYVQRRGRVLRKFDRWGKNKDKAYIYDFICLPFHVDYSSNLTDYEVNTGKSLVKDELERIKEFYDTCSNKHEVELIIDELIESYRLLEEGKQYDQT
jgi:superfamily II DNA or RNA helicase